jgi:RNA polymerase sigma factor (sigma-70 family)
MIVDNMGLVAYTIKMYFSFVLNTDRYDDYYQCGCIGLIKAAKAFKPEIGAFSTYAVSRIHGEIKRFGRDYENQDLKVNRNAQKLYFQYQQLHDDGYSLDEIYQELDIKPFKLNQIICAMAPVSIDACMYDEDGQATSFHDRIASSVNMEDEVVNNQFLNQFQAKLTDRERKIFDMRLNNKTQTEIAAATCVSQAHVSRIMCALKSEIKAAM